MGLSSRGDVRLSLGDGQGQRVSLGAPNLVQALHDAVTAADGHLKVKSFLYCYNYYLCACVCVCELNLHSHAPFLVLFFRLCLDLQNETSYLIRSDGV